MKVISWQPVLTDHQSYTLEALQQVSSCFLMVYVLKAENKARRLQGWVNRHADSLSPRLIPQKDWFMYIFRQLRDNRDAVHIFGSPFEQPKLIVTLILAIAMGLRVFLISEPYSPISKGYQNDNRKFINWAKALLRPLLYHFYGALLSRRIAGVFAISSLAVSQYHQIGVAKDKIFPFGYFVPRSELVGCEVSAIDIKKKGLRLIFIGTLIERKGLDVLITSIRSLNTKGVAVTLDVYGAGDVSQFDFDQSSINYCGLIPFGEAQSIIANYDVLVLPSRYDGWGVVVNEAIIAGVPVICSNRVGAGAVVEKWQCGAIFTSEDVSDLERIVNEIVFTTESLEKMRIASRNASAVIDPKVAGRYMFDVLKADTLSSKQQMPSCPWYEH